MTLFAQDGLVSSKPASTLNAKLSDLAHAAAFLHQQGWTPATSSNFSHRAASEGSTFFISISGKDKGALEATDFMEVNMGGKAVEKAIQCKPSAETLLHALVYQHYPNANTVLHTHSVNGTVVSKLLESEGQVVFENFEILKGLEGIKTHEAQVLIPIFPNSQDMAALAEQVATYVKSSTQPLYGFLLAGHGLYTWGENVAQARRHVEVLEFLMSCYLELRSHGYANFSR